MSKRFPGNVAFDEWVSSPEGVRCLSAGASGKFLRNRLELAFAAAWNACTQAVDEALSGPREVVTPAEPEGES